MAVTWTGMDALQRDLDRLAVDVAQDVRPIAEQHAQAAADQIRVRYPVVTGRLRAGVQVQARTGEPFGVRYQVISTAPYASFYEYGTSRQPAGKVFVPIAIKERRAMRREIGGVLESYGAQVRGDVDSSDLDTAVITRLQTDATLTSLLPDGVYMDVAPPGVTRFVLMGIMDSLDRVTYSGHRAIEQVLYFAKAVALSTAGANVKAAAARIDVLLDNVVLTVTGYDHVLVHRDEDEQPRIRDVQPDAVDPALRWLHRGGHYRLEASRPDPA